MQKKPVAVGILIFILLAVIAAETAVILSQQRVDHQIEVQSKKALGRFLKEGLPSTKEGGTVVLLKNVRFCWSPNICVNTDNLSANVIPLDDQFPVFDDLKSFIVNVHNADVMISPKTLEGMFNESVFNYPGSNLRNLTVGIDQNHVTLKGSLKYLLWIPFEMDTDLHVDQKTNTLTITVQTLHIFGFIPATGLLHIKPFELEKLLTLPENRYLTVHQNEIMVKPFGLFPPPRISGEMSDIVVTSKMLLLRFKGNPIEFSGIPMAGAKNYIYVSGGTAQFGPIRMLSTRIQVIDKNPGDLFRFSLLNYWHYVPLSQIKIQPDGAVILTMPDHEISEKANESQ